MAIAGVEIRLIIFILLLSICLPAAGDFQEKEWEAEKDPSADVSSESKLTPEESADNRNKAAQLAADPNAGVGKTYGYAQNPNNSATAPETTAAVNDATGNALEMNAAIDEMAAKNKLLAEDAAALKSMLAMGMMEASQAAASVGGAPISSPGVTTEIGSVSSPEPVTISSGITPVETYTPSINTVSIPNNESQGGVEILPPVVQPDSVIIGENTSAYIPSASLPSQQGQVFMAPGARGDFFSRGENGKVTIDDSAKGDRAIRGLASETYRGGQAGQVVGVVASETEDKDVLAERVQLKEALNRLQKPASKKDDEKKGAAASLAKADVASDAAKTKDTFRPLSAFGSALDKLGAKLKDAFEASLWPDAKGKPWKGANQLVASLLGMEEGPAAIQGASVSVETVPWLFALFLLGVSFSATVLLLPGLREFVFRRIPLLERLLPAKTEVWALVLDSGHEQQMQLIAAKKIGGGIHWQLGLRHKANGEFVVVGVPKEDAVFPAQCLPTRIQNELDIQHGLERVQFLGKNGFQKTSDEINPAFRPFPDKIGFLQQSGLLRGGKRSAA